jgi:hypothetical protein
MWCIAACDDVKRILAFERDAFVCFFVVDMRV